MNGLPKDVDLSFLLGKEVIQICCGLRESILRFDGAISITLECEFLLAIPSDEETETYPSCPPATKLLKTLGAQVTGITNHGTGELVITFSNKTSLTIFDSNSEYESYQISHPTGVIVV